MTLLDDVQEARKKFEEDHCCAPNVIVMTPDFYKDLMLECYNPFSYPSFSVFGMIIMIDKDSMEPFYLEEYGDE